MRARSANILAIRPRAACPALREFGTMSESPFHAVGAPPPFKTKSTNELLLAATIFGACSQQSFIRPSISFLKSTFDLDSAPPKAHRNPITIPLHWAIRNTVFSHFCAGETVSDCKRVANAMADANVKLIVDHSTEEFEDPASWAENLQNKKLLVSELSQVLGNSCRCIPIKVTALMSPAVLEELTKLIASESRSSIISAQDAQHAEEALIARLSSEQQELYHTAMGHLADLCSHAQSEGVALLFDAEQTHRQPAIDMISLQLMRRFNKKKGSGEVTIYNTFQMYLKDSLTRLRENLYKASLEADVVYGVKMVRGAYIATETTRAIEMGIEVPVHACLQDTHDSYNEGLREMIGRMGTGVGSEVALFVCTHNLDSVTLATKLMHSQGLEPSEPRVAFAQIMGMCDGLSMALGQRGYNSHKLVLFGDFQQIFPWLLRRLEENQDMLGAVQKQELPLLRDELKRRLGF